MKTHLSRLTRKRGVWSVRSREELVLNHVLQTLIVHWTGEHVCANDVASEPAVQELFPVVAVAIIHQNSTTIFNVVASEGCSVASIAVNEP